MKITCTTAKVAATSPDGTPAVTVNKFGKGMCVVSAAARNTEEMPHNAAALILPVKSSASKAAARQQ